MTTSQVALLRGINVGGKNKVPMAELRAALEQAGFAAVQTYIASGNVLFADGRSREELEHAIEAVVRETFGFSVVVAVRSHAQLRAVVAKAPKGFGQEPDRFHEDVVFLKHPLTAAQAMAVVQTREGVDRAWKGSGVIYFQRLSAERTKSKMGAIAGTEPYAFMTIRNWRTTTTLLRMLKERMSIDAGQ